MLFAFTLIMKIQFGYSLFSFFKARFVIAIIGVLSSMALGVMAKAQDEKEGRDIEKEEEGNRAQL